MNITEDQTQAAFTSIVEEFRLLSARFPGSEVWYHKAIGGVESLISFFRDLPEHDPEGEIECQFNDAFDEIQSIFKAVFTQQISSAVEREAFPNSVNAVQSVESDRLGSNGIDEESDSTTNSGDTCAAPLADAPVLANSLSKCKQESSSDEAGQGGNHCPFCGFDREPDFSYCSICNQYSDPLEPQSIQRAEQGSGSFVPSIYDRSQPDAYNEAARAMADRLSVTKHQSDEK
ncbi:MAG: hypothetical protein PHH11_11590 [Methylomonas sp.]|nr:hypothetical protein [Methylomonas sp.]